MSSTFTGYSIAVSGMMVNQSGLSVTSHNLANVNTTGFSRQRMVSQETTISQTSGVSWGSGTSVEEIKRARSQFLDQTYRQQNATLSYWEAKSTTITDIQQFLSEFSSDDGTSDNGFQQTMQDFFDSWDQLASDPSSQSARSSVREAANTLIGTITQIAEQLTQLQQDCVTNVLDAVDDLNDMAGQVADLNMQIMQTEAAGSDANDLRDQRDQLIDRMSSLSNITVSEQSNGMVNISINGVSLVQGKQSYTLAAAGDGSTENPLAVRSVEFDTAVKITGGSIKAYLEDADQTGMATIEDADIPYDMTASGDSSISNLWQALNDLITTIALKVNELQSSGTGLDGSTGIAFFSPVDENKPLSLSNIQVNPVLEDLDAIAAGTSGASGDNAIASQIAELNAQEYFEMNGLMMDMDTFYQSVISWLGTTGEQASGYYDTQASLLSQIDTQRQSVSAVSMDEEMSKVVMYQNAYNASARVLKMMDSLLEEVIAGLG